MRVTTRAVIIEDGKILLCKYDDGVGEIYCCPGGGHEEDEDMIMNVQRECMEELNVHIEVDDFAFMREANFIFKGKPVHQLEHYFYCKIKDGEKVSAGSHVDKDCIGIEWIDLEKLPLLRTYPVDFTAALQANKPFYINDFAL